MCWKSVFFILKAQFYEMLLDLEQESCRDKRWNLPLWNLPLELQHEHISEHEDSLFLRNMSFKRHEDKKETVGVSRDISKHTLNS